MTGHDYMRLVKEANCVICWNKLGVKNCPCDAHHVGTGNDRNDFATISLCKEHHQGATGVHGLHRAGFERLWKTSAIEMLAWTNREIHR